MATSGGMVPVELLRVGDRVVTRDNGFQEIRWIGSVTVTKPQLDLLPELRPIRIERGALGGKLPERASLVSPNHRMLLGNELTRMLFDEEEVLAAAGHLVGSQGVSVADVEQVTYVHFMFDEHQVVLVDGLWSESFAPGAHILSSLERAQRDEILTLFPDLEALDDDVPGYMAARPALRRFEAALLRQETGAVPMRWQ